MKKILLILILVAVVSKIVGSTYYVATNGNDGNIGTINNPLLTVNAAITKCVNTSFDTIILRGGVYPITTKISFASADSNIIVKNYTGETPIISGGYSFVGGWSLYDTINNIYSIGVPSTLSNREMYINHSGTISRCVRARANTSLYGSGWKHDSTGSYDSNSSFLTWVEPKKIEAVWPDWFYEDRSLIDTITIFNTIGSYIKYKDNVWNCIKSKYRATGRSYPTPFFENSYTFLDSVSEWYVNKTTNYLYYKPRTGENLATDTVIVANLDTLVNINSTKNVKFYGVNFRYGTWMRPSLHSMAQGGGMSLYDSMASNTNYSQIINYVYIMPSNVNVSNSSKVSFTNCEFSYTGGGGVIGFDSMCREDTVTRCNFYKTTGPAISATPSYVSKYPTKISCTYNTAIYSCDIYRGTRVFEMQHLDSSDISHNTVSNAPWCGIYIGENPKNTNCSYNKIDSTCKLFLDGGQIYTCGTSTNTKIFKNYLGPTKRDLTANMFLDNGGGVYGNNFEIYSNIFDGLCKALFWSGPYNNNVHDNYVAITDTWLTANPAYNNTFTNNDTAVYKWPQNAVNIMDSAGSIPRSTYTKLSITYPSGTKYVVPIDVDTTKIIGSTNTMLYSKVIVANDKIKSNITTKNNIAVFDAVLNKYIKKTVSYRTLDTINIDWVAPANKETAKNRFYICFGNSINAPDSAQMYSSANVIRRFTFDNDTIIDRTGNSTGSTVDSVTYWRFGDMRGIKLNLAGKFVATTALPQSFNAEILAYYDKTLSTGGGMVMSSVTSGTGTRVYFTSDFLQVYLYNNTGSTLAPNSSLRDKMWHVVSIDKNVNTSNIFSEKEKVVTNGSVGNSTHGAFTIGSYSGVNNSYRGYIDDITIRSTADPDSVYYTRYEMIRPTSIMLMQREGFLVPSTTGSRWDAFKSSVKSAYKKAWK